MSPRSSSISTMPAVNMSLPKRSITGCACCAPCCPRLPGGWRPSPPLPLPGGFGGRASMCQAVDGCLVADAFKVSCLSL